MFIYKCFILLNLVLIYSSQIKAQNDAEGCKDHPLFTRMNGFYIAECVTKYDEAEFVGEGYKLIGGKLNIKKVEGNMTRIKYVLKEGASRPSLVQIRRNYGNALKSIGGKVVMETAEWDQGNADLITLHYSKVGKTAWASVYIHHFSEGNEFILTVIEPTEMQQEVVAHALLKELNDKGFVSLQINFDISKAIIKPDSKQVIEQIAEMMQKDPTLKISIEGHTDNVGIAAANKSLSQLRAKAVADAVIKEGISKDRITSKGHGQEKPIADNATEEGRAQNRRVEIVKLN